MNIANVRESSKDVQLLETTGRTQTASITLEEGQQTSDELNTHPRSDQTVLVLEGELDTEVGVERERLRKGQSLIIPAGVKHRLSNRGPGIVFAFTVYAPSASQTDDPS